MTLRKSRIATLSMALLGLASSQSGLAASDAWEYEANFYLHAAGMKGDAGVHGVTAKVDSSFSDIWDHLDAGFMGLFNARKGPWSLGLDLVYMKLEADESKSVSGPFGKVAVNGAMDITTSLYVAMASVGYRVLDDRTKIDVLGGLRYTRLEADAEINVAAGVAFPGGSISADGHDDWVDGVVGLKVLHPLNDTMSLVGYVDVGAGGSDFTYQLIAGANWEFAPEYTAKVGYRLMYWDYESGGNVWDITASGPYMGLGIRF